KEKLFMRHILSTELEKIGGKKSDIKLLFPEHHLSHAASAFYPSPFDEAAILTIDGVGEWATTLIAHGKKNKIHVLRQLDFPHSLGLLYSAFTYYCGFKVNSGEYKLMGLAPYGDPDSEQTHNWETLIKTHLVDIRPDGSFLLNMDYFNYATGLTMCHEKRWEQLFGISQRSPETEVTQPYMNMALAIQRVTEEIVLLLAKTAASLTGSKYLTMAGGVALNCVANGKLLKQNIVEDIWIQPASGDAGGALGAAYAAHYIWNQQPRLTVNNPDAMQGAYLGPSFETSSIKRILKRFHAPYDEYSDFQKLCQDITNYLEQGLVIGWFQGRMEYGPRALGNRSILADARHPDTQKKLNLKIKYREGFRPFAPSVLEQDIADYFELDRPSPYMLLVADVCEKRKLALPQGYTQKTVWDRLYVLRSDIPAVTHVDYSARIQSVCPKTNERYFQLITAFKQKTGYGVIVNTSFNVRGEPIVCTPQDAYVCFMRTEMDILVVQDLVLKKNDQPEFKDSNDWRKTFMLD
ncbi:MAG: hypothetical protein HQK77_16060, partial [Desulfobacterales bacterium]|nr:hypothetical protein [Desulfobacterales bacterium]